MSEVKEEKGVVFDMNCDDVNYVPVWCNKCQAMSKIPVDDHVMDYEPVSPGSDDYDKDKRLFRLKWTGFLDVTDVECDVCGEKLLFDYIHFKNSPADIKEFKQKRAKLKANFKSWLRMSRKKRDEVRARQKAMRKEKKKRDEEKNKA